MRLLLIFCLTLLVLICGDMFQVFSEAPTTPKILFTSTRDGNREVYMMNPDGSEQVNLTQHPPLIWVRCGLRRVSRYSSSRIARARVCGTCI